VDRWRRYRWWLVGSAVALILAGWWWLPGGARKARFEPKAASVAAGMSRAEVEAILGPLHGLLTFDGDGSFGLFKFEKGESLRVYIETRRAVWGMKELFSVQVHYDNAGWVKQVVRAKSPPWYKQGLGKAGLIAPPLASSTTN
jgi:hypothetical protein